MPFIDSHAHLAGEGFATDRGEVLQRLRDAGGLGVVCIGESLEAMDRIAVAMPGQLSSTAQDLVRGKPTEIDHLNGFVARRGRELGVATPVNQTLHALVKLVEAGHGHGRRTPAGAAHRDGWRRCGTKKAAHAAGTGTHSDPSSTTPASSLPASPPVLSVLRRAWRRPRPPSRPCPRAGEASC